MNEGLLNMVRHRLLAVGVVVLLIGTTCGYCLGGGVSTSSPSVVLVTGFEPFGNYSVNPSGEVALALNGTMVDGAVVVGVVLPVNFTAAVTAAEAAITRYHPVLVISTGLNARLHRIAVEHVAVDLRQQPRVNGRWVPPTVLDPSGPLVRHATIPVKQCVTSMRADGVPVRGSWWAGTYVCNAVFYGELGYTEGSGVRVGFVHVPLLESQDPSGLPLSVDVTAVRQVISSSLASCS